MRNSAGTLQTQEEKSRRSELNSYKEMSKAGALFFEEDGVLEREPGEGRVGEERGDFVGFALSESEGNRRGAKEKLFEVKDGSRVWRSGREKKKVHQRCCRC